MALFDELAEVLYQAGWGRATDEVALKSQIDRLISRAVMSERHCWDIQQTLFDLLGWENDVNGSPKWSDALAEVRRLKETERVQRATIARLAVAPSPAPTMALAPDGAFTAQAFTAEEIAVLRRLAKLYPGHDQ